MRPRFLADADLRQPIVRGLKRVEAGIDFETAQQAGLEGMPDSDVLRLAAAKGRILVSHDRRTMASSFHGFIRDQRSPGLILVKQDCSLRQAIEQLRICFHVLTAEEFVNRIQYIPF